jgi:hypothetical protein
MALQMALFEEFGRKLCGGVSRSGRFIRTDALMWKPLSAA